MCVITRSIASCGHPVNEDIDRCEKADEMNWEYCDPDDDTLPGGYDDRMEIPEKCGACQQSAIEREEIAETLSVQRQSIEELEEQDKHYEAEAERLLNETTQQVPPNGEAQFDTNLAAVLEQSRQEAEIMQQQMEKRFDDETRQAMELSAQEQPQRTVQDFDEEVRRAMAASAQEYQGQVDVDYEDELAAALAASKLDAPRDLLQCAEEEEVVRRLMQQTGKEFENRYNAEALADDDPALREIIERSMVDWHRSTWRDELPQTQPRNRELRDLDPEGKGKGPRQHDDEDDEEDSNPDLPSYPDPWGRDAGKFFPGSSGLGAFRERQYPTSTASLARSQKVEG